MSLNRVVGIITSNHHKVEEIGFDLAYYGIAVEQLQEFDSEFLKPRDTSKHRIRPIAIIREQTKLVDRDGNLIQYPDFPHLKPVVHKSHIHVWFPNGDERDYKVGVDGVIDLTRKRPVDPSGSIFGWDDIFLVSNIYKTYQELKELDHKYSARDYALSQFIRDTIHYKENVDLVHFPQDYDNVVDFNKDPTEFIDSVPEFNNPIAQQMLLTNIPTTALNYGMFFRSAKNRRQKLYWCPGLNAGIPFVPKPKDPKHELTYMFHDMTHFCIPDLVYDGGEDKMTRKVYIAYRLMSEAITLVVGDMLFVHSMITSGYEYKTVAGRKIYPIYAHMNNPPISELIRGSYEYCFYGDTTRWLGLTDGSEAAKNAISEFTDKYDKYFLEDFRWTRMNYDYMVNHNTTYKRWWSAIKPIRDHHGLQLFSVSEWVGKLPVCSNTCDFNDAVFDSVYTHYIAPLFKGRVIRRSLETRQKEAFIRYMMGQMCIFWRYIDIYPQTDDFIKTIGKSLIHFNNDSISNIREFYQNYLEQLQKNSLISLDDKNTFAEVYPIFNPFIVDYDHMNAETTLADFSKMILEV